MMGDISYKEEIRRETALAFAIKNCDSEKNPALLVKDAEVFLIFLKGKAAPKRKAKTGAK